MDHTETQMCAMIAQLNAASDAYYNGRQERMTDYEWDALFDQLQELETATGLVLPDSPTQRVSADTVGGQKEAHEFPALSLAKTKQVADLAKWADGRAVWLSWKLDGLTLVATYDAGHLTHLVTRGNGEVGTNLIHLAPALLDLPETITEKGHLVIRGEAVISYADFETFRMETGEEYANPRNLASGSLALKDLQEVRRRKIHWQPFTLVDTERELPAWGERMEFLVDLGFHPVEREQLLHPDVQILQDAIDRWTEKVTGLQNPYPVDGLVLTYDDTAYAATGSVTGHHATRAGLAFKWQDESAVSTLQEIEWSCAASTITPVAVFAPVDLEGTTVRRASLCNISECERLGIGGPDTVLSVIKANKIIPKVIRVEKAVGSFDIPSVCPVCGAATEIQTNAVSHTRTLHCTNPDCTAKQLKKFSRFVSKSALDIDGISEQTLSRFINRGWIRSYADIFRLPSHRAEIVEMEGFGEKSVENLLQAIARARQTTGQKLLFGLCIPLCGVEVAKLLLAAHPFMELVALARKAEDPEVFSDIAGIGPEKSSSFVAWMQDEEQAAMLDDLLTEIEVEDTAPVEAGNRCAGLTFVVTGEVHTYQNRKELKDYIESQGGKVAGSVSGATSYLINNDVTSTSGKNRKAKELGIPVLSEEAFRKQFT